MIVVEVEKADVAERSGVGEKGPWKIRNQIVYGHLMDPETATLKRYPTEIKVRLQDDQRPYVPGYYMLSPTSIFADRYDAFAVDCDLVTVEEYQRLVSLAIAQRIPKAEQHKPEGKGA
ncbi:G5P family DNA-binding protein [Chromobacterium sp. IIBBL 290-4]|uniref:G5P family DNA-binding protein n=1 Tax=Chromobacterium sp. IIBBL 290-4 TaxID=2953890 RepID=UPI0020B8A343|nr:G5P family DNA-binding protein [Chromobacterium sp. IIBBL 290-4]UTH73588.1 G5P family DNA-binding protein [Chromobacterium sp. IIBBL 290-4]